MFNSGKKRYAKLAEMQVKNIFHPQQKPLLDPELFNLHIVKTVKTDV